MRIGKIHPFFKLLSRIPPIIKKRPAIVNRPILSPNIKWINRRDRTGERYVI